MKPESAMRMTMTRTVTKRGAVTKRRAATKYPVTILARTIATTD